MAQYLVAMRLRQLVGGDLAITGYNMPEWGLVAPMQSPEGRTLPDLSGNLFDLRQVAAWLKSGKLERIGLSGFGFRREHFPACGEARSLFVSSVAPRESLDDDELLINVRAEDILGRGIHPDYGLLPIEFYRTVVQRTGLKPVFQGQIEDGPYMDGLVKAFPEARVLPSQGAVADFQIIRQAKSIVLSLSSFTWIAAWLSQAREIHVPVYGFLNPRQRPDIDLLPVGDERYRFYAFPVRRWNGSLSQQNELLRDGPFSRQMPPAEVRRILSRARWSQAGKRWLKKAEFAWVCVRHGGGETSGNAAGGEMGPSAVIPGGPS